MKPPREGLKILSIVPYFLIGPFPVLLLLLRALRESLEVGASAFLIFDIQREAVLFFKTVAYSGAVAASVTCAGVWAAIFVCGPGQKIYLQLARLLFVSLPIPAVVHALAWISWSGVLKRSGFVLLTSRGWVMSWLVQSMTLMPLAFLIIAGGVLAINKEQIWAAQLLGQDTRYLARLLPRYLKPQILATAVIVFILTVNDYAIPSIFSTSVYALEIFVEYSSSLSLTRTILKSLPLMAVQIALLVSVLDLMAKVFLSGKKGEFSEVTLKLQPVIKGFSSLALVLGFVQLGVPASAILLDQGVWRELGTTWASSSPDLMTSLLIAFLAAAVGCPVMYWMAEWLAVTRFQKTGMFIVLLPAVLPATIMGTALIHLFNHPSTSFIYNSVLMPVLAVLARFMPFGVMIATAWIKRIDPNLMQAARLLEGREMHNRLKIAVPLASTGVLLATALVFLLTIGELGATVIVLPPGLSTVTVRLYNYLHYGATEMVLGLALMLMIVTGVIAGLVGMLGSGRSRGLNRWIVFVVLGWQSLLKFWRKQ